MTPNLLVFMLLKGPFSIFLEKFIIWTSLLISPLFSDGFTKHIDTTSIGLPIVCLKGSQVEMSKS